MDDLLSITWLRIQLASSCRIPPIDRVESTLRRDRCTLAREPLECEFQQALVKERGPSTSCALAARRRATSPRLGFNGAQRGFEPPAQNIDFAWSFVRTVVIYPQLYPHQWVTTLEPARNMRKYEIDLADAEQQWLSRDSRFGTSGFLHPSNP
jgi:hypothetical protein